MILLSILLGFLNAALPKNNVKVDFEFTDVQFGKPTLAFYHYNVTMENKTGQPVYVIIPRWFGEEIAATGKIWGAQIDDFDKVKGNTLFSLDDNNNFTIFILKAKEKLVVKDFTIETFDEGISKKLTTGLNILIVQNMKVGDYSLTEFMQKDDQHDKNLVYKLEGVIQKDLTISTSKK